MATVDLAAVDLHGHNDQWLVSQWICMATVDLTTVDLATVDLHGHSRSGHIGPCHGRSAWPQWIWLQ